MTNQINIIDDADISEHFRLLVDGVRDYAIFMLDPQGYIVTWNPGAERIKGYAAEEVVGKHFSMFYPDTDRQAAKPERILKTAELEGSCEDEGWRVRKDGTRFWANVVVTVLRTPEGKVSGFAKVTKDITVQKLAADALHQSEERFRLLVENVRDYAIYLLSPEGRIVSWNLGATRIKGYIQEEVLGKHFSIFYPPEDVKSGKPDLELEVALAESRYEEEGWRVRKDGTRFWASVIITPVRDRLGALVGFAKVTRDLTDRRRAREELMASQQHARDLTLDNAAKEEFLGTVAHELRSPLAVLYGSSQFLHRHLDTLSRDEAKELVDDIANEAQKFTSLVENLLAMARPADGGVALKESNLHEATLASVAAFERRSPNRKLDMSVADQAICVKIEPAFFDRVIQNLLDNADKYSGNDQPIEIRIERRGNNAVVEVLDRGPGVDPSELSKIFDSFYRSPRTMSVGSGKGLGLSVCKRLLGFMDGSIDARPREGGGLILAVSLPMAC